MYSNDFKKCSLWRFTCETPRLCLQVHLFLLVHWGTNSLHWIPYLPYRQCSWSCTSLQRYLHRRHPVVVDELILINNRIHAKSILAGKVYSLLKPVTPGLIYLFFQRITKRLNVSFTYWWTPWLMFLPVVELFLVFKLAKK